jgi:hypothetical protein
MQMEYKLLSNRLDYDPQKLIDDFMVITEQGPLLTLVLMISYVILMLLPLLFIQTGANAMSILIMTPVLIVLLWGPCIVIWKVKSRQNGSPDQSNCASCINTNNVLCYFAVFLLCFILWFTIEQNALQLVIGLLFYEGFAIWVLVNLYWHSLSKENIIRQKIYKEDIIMKTKINLICEALKDKMDQTILIQVNSFINSLDNNNNKQPIINYQSVT